MGKIQILLGAGVGYVLGARAGRERYDQIEEQARRLWSKPQVQRVADQAGDLAKEKGAQARDKVQEKVESATGGSDASSDSAGPSTLDGEMPPVVSSPPATFGQHD